MDAAFACNGARGRPVEGGDDEPEAEPDETDVYGFGRVVLDPTEAAAAAEGTAGIAAGVSTPPSGPALAASLSLSFCSSAVFLSSSAFLLSNCFRSAFSFRSSSSPINFSSSNSVGARAVLSTSRTYARLSSASLFRFSTSSPSPLSNNASTAQLSV